MASMNKAVLCAVSASMMVLLASCGQTTGSNTVSSTRVTEARQFLHDEVVHGRASAEPVTFRVFAHGESYVKNIDITPTRIKITTEKDISSEGKLFAFSLKQLTPGMVCDDHACLVSIIRDGSLVRGHYISYEFSLANDKNAAEKADKLAYALSTLQKAAFELRSDDPKFKKIVDDYRDASPKPTLPDEANRLKMKAEEAARNNQFNDAVDYDAQALEIAPWWPEGHFNLAINLAEAKDYKGATDYAAALDEMNCYLMLAPQGADSGVAEDKIKEWDKKIHKPKWYKF